MNNELISKSKRSFSNNSILILGIIMVSFFIFLFDHNFQPKTPEDQKLKVTIFIGQNALILYLIYYLLDQKSIHVYENYFVVKRLLRSQRIYYSEVITHFSEDFQGKYQTWTEYYLILNTDEKITLTNSEYSNFNEFFPKIKRRIKNNESINTKLSQPKYLTYALFCGIIAAFLFFISSFFYDFKKLENSDFTILKLERKIVWRLS